jgi:pSer/pThr/pTyr-binding forkhead associated (FHA) protein
VTLVPGCLVVGRGTAVGLHLDSRFVSRRHCQFVTTPEQTLVEDLGSANGIRVNDQRCSVQRVAAGDTITLGDYTLSCIETTPKR